MAESISDTLTDQDIPGAILNEPLERATVPSYDGTVALSKGSFRIAPGISWSVKVSLILSAI